MPVVAINCTISWDIQNLLFQLAYKRDFGSFLLCRVIWLCAWNNSSTTCVYMTEWLKNVFCSCDGNSGSSRNLILMEVLKLNGIAPFIVGSVCRRFDCAHGLSTFRFDAVWFIDFSAKILIDGYNGLETVILSLISKYPRSRFIQCWSWCYSGDDFQVEFWYALLDLCAS